MARKPRLVTLVVDIEARHRAYLDRKIRDLQASEELQANPDAVTDSVVVRQLINAWMALESGSTLEEEA